MGDCVNRMIFGYALFVVVAVVILASLPFFVGKINSIYLLVILIAIGFLWAILRIYMRQKSVAEKENVGNLRD